MATDAQLQSVLNTVAILADQIADLIDQLQVSQAPPSVPAAPYGVTQGTTTTTTAAFTWSQSGAVNGWDVYVRTASGTYTYAPTQVVSTAAVTLTGLSNGTAYFVSIYAYNDSGLSPPVEVSFQTSAGTARVTTTSSAMKTTAKAAAASASDGSKNAAYTASLVSTLAASPKFCIVDRSAGTPDRYVETVTLTSDATGVSIPTSGTVTTALATTVASMADPWVEVRKASDATVKIAVPLAVGAFTGDLSISGDIASGQAVGRSDVLRLNLPSTAFDTGSTATSSVEKIISDMTAKNENGLYPDTYTNADDSLRPGSQYAYVDVQLRAGNPLYGGYWAGLFSDGVIQGTSYASQSFWHQAWGWIGSGNRITGGGVGPGNTATNTRVQCKGCKLLALRFDGTWETWGSASMDGYPESFGSWYQSSRNNTIQDIASGSALSQGKDETSNGGGWSLGSIGLGTASSGISLQDSTSRYYPGEALNYLNWNIHFWPTRALKSMADLIANYHGTMVVFQTRKILHNTGGTDDRANARMVASAGMDIGYASGGYASGMHHGRFSEVQNTWTLHASTDIPPTILRTYPPSNTLLGVA